MGDYIVKGIPDDLHRRLRIGTVAKGTTIKRVIMASLLRFDREFTADPAAMVSPHEVAASEQYPVSAFEEMHPDGVCRHPGVKKLGDGSYDCPKLRVKVGAARSV